MAQLKAVDELPKIERQIGSRSSKYLNIIQEFLESDTRTAIVDLSDEKVKPQTAYQSLSRAAKKLGGVKVVKRGGDIYLVKVDEE